MTAAAVSTAAPGAPSRTPARRLPPEAPPGELLPAPENWPDDPGPEAFYGPAGAIVRAIEPHTEADPNAILAQILVGFGNLIGRKAHFVVENTSMFTNEFLVLVGKSAKGRKGTAWNRALQALSAADPTWAANCLRSGLASGEGLIEAVRDGDGEKDPGIADKRLLVEEEEFAGVLRQSQRQGNILSAVIRTAWDKGHLNNLTKKAVRATSAHISIIGHITEEELKDSLTKIEQANGFGNRFLWICSRRRRLLPGGSRQSPEIDRQIEALRQAAEAARAIGRMRWSPRAEKTWRRIYTEVSGDEAGIVGSLTGRAEAHITRLACIYALIDGQAAISHDHLAAAVALWQYSARCVRFIFGKRSGTPVADTILSALQKTPDGLTRENVRALFSRHQPAARIDQALSYLANQKLITVDRVATRGRPRDVWRLAANVPAAAPPELGAALRRMVETFDDPSVNRLWQQVRQVAADASPAEIEHAVALQMPRIRSGAIQSPVGYLLTVVPAWFTGNALAEYRAQQAQQIEKAPAEIVSAAEAYELRRRLLIMYREQLSKDLDAQTRSVVEQNLAATERWLREHPDPHQSPIEEREREREEYMREKRGKRGKG
jgi:hypothetical protein